MVMRRTHSTLTSCCNRGQYVRKILSVICNTLGEQHFGVPWNSGEFTHLVLRGKTRTSSSWWQ